MCMDVCMMCVCSVCVGVELTFIPNLEQACKMLKQLINNFFNITMWIYLCTCTTKMNMFMQPYL